MGAVAQTSFSSLPSPIVWLNSGWRDFCRTPGVSLAYGTGFCIASWILIGALFFFNADWMLMPLLAGFTIIGPIAAVGLYEVSRRLSDGEPVSFASALFVKTRSPGQIAFAGMLLMVLLLAWIRSATIIHALFFGLQPFSGIEELLRTLFLTVDGWLMLSVGSLVGLGFAFLAFSVSVFSIPMMMVKDVDVVTAIVKSVQCVRGNAKTMLGWGLIVAGLTVIGIATGFIGMLLIFPILGHATWHAYVSAFGRD